MTKPISADEFLPTLNYSDSTFGSGCLRFGKSLYIHYGIYPCKVRYVPFYEQLATQLTPLIKRQINRSFVNHFEFQFKIRYHSHEGPPYYKRYYYKKYGVSEPCVEVSECNIYGELFEFHKDGYAYGCVGVCPKRDSMYSCADVWFRWKSNLPDYEYIEPTDELELKAEDITFELCDAVPDEFLLRLYAKTSDEYDVTQWKRDMAEDYYYPKKRRKPKRVIPFEIMKTCKYPDVTFTLYFDEEITADLKDLVETEFINFQTEWDAANYEGIDDIILADDLDELYGEETIANMDKEGIVKVLVDFGSCNPNIIKKLVKWLERTDLNITRMTAE